jgi:hypothetical protein
MRTGNADIPTRIRRSLELAGMKQFRPARPGPLARISIQPDAGAHSHKASEDWVRLPPPIRTCDEPPRASKALSSNGPAKVRLILDETAEDGAVTPPPACA